MKFQVTIRPHICYLNMKSKRVIPITEHLCDCACYPAVRYTGDGYECARCQKLNALVKHDCDRPTQNFEEWCEARRKELERYRMNKWLKRKAARNAA